MSQDVFRCDSRNKWTRGRYDNALWRVLDRHRAPFSKVTMGERICKGLPECEYRVVLDLDLLTIGQIDGDRANSSFHYSECVHSGAE